MLEEKEIITTPKYWIGQTVIVGATDNFPAYQGVISGAKFYGGWFYSFVIDYVCGADSKKQYSECSEEFIMGAAKTNLI